MQSAYQVGAKSKLDITIAQKQVLKTQAAMSAARKADKLPKVDKALYKQTLALQIREYMRLNGLSQAACARALGLTAARVSQLLKGN